MAIKPDTTPNPNALKFIVGVDVGGPRSYVRSNAGDDPMAERLLAIDGISNVFMTADFVTVSKSAEADWSTIVPQAQAVLEQYYHSQSEAG